MLEINYKNCLLFHVAFFKVFDADSWRSLVSLLSEIKRKNELRFNLELPEIYGSCAAHLAFVCFLTCNSRVWQAIFSVEVCLLSGETSFVAQQ